MSIFWYIFGAGILVSIGALISDTVIDAILKALKIYDKFGK